MSEIGKEVRLNQIMNAESGNSVILAMDHAVVHGPIEGIVDVVATVENLCQGGPDTFFMPMGAVKRVYDSFLKHRIPFLVSIDTATHMGPEPDLFLLTDTVEHALRVGASGVSMHALIGPPRTMDMLAGLAGVAESCDRLGVPLLAIMYPAGFDDNYAVEHVKWAARMGAELGADIVKTYYTGSPDTFAEVVQSCPVPIMMSGGAKTDDPRDFLAALKGSMDGGGRGCAVGRNVWQYKDPVSMLRAVRRIVHEGASVSEAAAELD